MPPSPRRGTAGGRARDGPRRAGSLSAAGALVAGGIGASLFLAALWGVQLRTRDGGISDVGWAASLGALAVFYAFALHEGWEPRRWLVAILAGAWSARLAWYLLVDRVLKGGEDGRWARLRERFGDLDALGFFAVFQLQAWLAVVLSGAYLLAMRVPATGWRAWDAVGVVLVAVSVVGEAIADRQLARWRDDPTKRGKTCREGLWRYSRHPNYFFEWIQWWAWPAIAVGAPWGWAALYAPVLMLLFILKVSGIPPTERRALQSRGEDYRRYQETTSAFVPWPPSR